MSYVNKKHLDPTNNFRQKNGQLEQFWQVDYDDFGRGNADDPDSVWTDWEKLDGKDLGVGHWRAVTQVD